LCWLVGYQLPTVALNCHILSVVHVCVCVSRDGRFKHMLIRSNCESAAFYRCGRLEWKKTNKKLKALTALQQRLNVRQYTLNCMNHTHAHTHTHSCMNYVHTFALSSVNRAHTQLFHSLTYLLSYLLVCRVRMA